jgi:hypothetical protein
MALRARRPHGLNVKCKVKSTAARVGATLQGHPGCAKDTLFRWLQADSSFVGMT